MNEERAAQLAIVTLIAFIALVGWVLPDYLGMSQSDSTALPPTELPPTPEPAPSPTPVLRPAVVIDTDMGADDWMAILYLLQRPDLEVKAITVTGAGMAHCEAGVKNALGLAALAGSGEIPVACGLEKPLIGEHAYPDEWRQAVDDLLGLTLPESQQVPSELTAVQLLTTTIQSSPGKVSLLTLGPLTNVGEALHSYPAIKDRLEVVFIMGGSVNSPGNVGLSGLEIENNTAEWNFYIDPFAANLVLGSGAPITLVPLDATNHVPLTYKLFSRLESQRNSPEAAFVFDVMNARPELIDSGAFYLWDPLAAAMLTDESLGVFQEKSLCVVEEEGTESGWSKPGNRCPPVRVAITADGYRFEQLFVDTLNGAAP